MSEEWGPWIEHDGRGYPVPAGTVVQALTRSGLREIVTVLHENPQFNLWDWNTCPHWFDLHVVMYRVRKPRGLTVLQNIASTPSQPVREDA